MKVLTNVFFASFAFTWDKNDPLYSTGGEFDPTKLKDGTGSVLIAMDVQDTEMIVGALKHVEPVMTEVAVGTYIVGKSE